MPVRTARARTMLVAGTATALSVATFLVPFGGSASAAAGVTLSPSAGPYSSGSTINVSGTGFPSLSSDPSGLSIIECSDPGGLSANLPVTAAGCDASTAYPLPISQSSGGAFGPIGFQVQALSTSTGSSIDCGNTTATECVLWVGPDFNNAFTTNDAFSAPFEVTTPVVSTPEAPLAIALPIGAVLVVGGTVFVARRRRRTVVL
jgi:hypothetical protein